MIANASRLLYMNVRGASESVKMLLEYLHLSYSGIKQEIDGIKPIQCTNEQWEKTKEALMVEFPTSISMSDCDPKILLSSSISIFKYLAYKYKPKMAGSAMNEFAEIDTLLCLVHDMRNLLIDAQEENWEVNKLEAMSVINEKMGYLNKFMRSKIWLSGKQVSIADFAICELLEYISSIDSSCATEKFPNCLKLLRKFNAIPEISKYKKSHSCYEIENNPE